MADVNKKDRLTPYTMRSQNKEDPDFAQLLFQVCQQKHKKKTVKQLKNQEQNITTIAVKLFRCICATISDEVFFYAAEEMPNAKNTFRAQRWFTTGLHKVAFDMEHTIMKAEDSAKLSGMLNIYICKDEKIEHYDSYVNQSIALVNQQRINKDFNPCPLEKELTIKPGSVYFFYTACTVLFTVEHRAIALQTAIKTEAEIKTEADIITIEDTPPDLMKNKKPIRPKRNISPPFIKVAVQVDMNGIKKGENAPFNPSTNEIPAKKQKLNGERDRQASCSKISREGSDKEKTLEELNEAKHEIEKLKSGIKETIETLREVLENLRKKRKSTKNNL